MIDRGVGARELQGYVVELWQKYAMHYRSEGGVAFHKLLNKAIINDTVCQVAMFAPFSRVLNSALVCTPALARPVTVYRGSKLTRSAAWNLHLGLARVAMYVAASREKRVAKAFSDCGVMVRLFIPPDCQNVGYLGSTRFWNQDEREYLLPPYTAVRIRNRLESDDELWLSVDVMRDNREESEDLPTILL